MTGHEPDVPDLAGHDAPRVLRALGALMDRRPLQLDLRRQDLRLYDFGRDGLNYGGCDFRGADLRGVVLVGVSFEWANFCDALMDGVVLGDDTLQDLVDSIMLNGWPRLSFRGFHNKTLVITKFGATMAHVLGDGRDRRLETFAFRLDPRRDPGGLAVAWRRHDLQYVGAVSFST